MTNIHYPGMYRVIQFKEVQEKANILLNEYIDFDYESNYMKKLIEYKTTIKDKISVSTTSLNIKDLKELQNDLVDLHNHAILTYIFYNKSYMIKPLNDNVLKNVNTVQKEALDIFTKKNKDYGDAFAVYGIVGVLVRIGDKLFRLETLYKNKKHAVSDESIIDTILDLYNYSTIALMLVMELDQCNVDKCKVNNVNKKLEEKLGEKLEEKLEEKLKVKYEEYVGNFKKYNNIRLEYEALDSELKNNCYHKWVGKVDEYCDGRTPHICELCGDTD